MVALEHGVDACQVDRRQRVDVPREPRDELEQAQVRGVWLDEAGRIFLDTDIGFGLVHTLDTALAADAIETQAWPLRELPFAQMPARFGFRLNPADPP